MTIVKEDLLSYANFYQYSNYHDTKLVRDFVYVRLNGIAHLSERIHKQYVSSMR